jgi:hypothetical protein
MLKNWYAICDNDWLFEKKIKSELQLLLYISSLTAEKGFCFASNSHLSKKLKLHETNISKKIKKLEKLWFVNIEYEYRWWEVISRKIRLAKTLTDDRQKHQPTISKNAKDNNTSINNNSKELKKIESSSNIVNKIEYWDKEINALLEFLYKSIWIDDFKEPQKWQRIFWKQCITLIKRIWKQEFIRRFKLVLEDNFKIKNCNSINYLYKEIKSFMHSPLVWSISDRVIVDNLSKNLDIKQKKKLNEIIGTWKEAHKHKELSEWVIQNMIDSIL